MSIAGPIHRNLHQPLGVRVPTVVALDSGDFAGMIPMPGAGSSQALSIGQSSGSTATAPLTQCAGAGAYENYIGRSTGSGECVALVRATNPSIGSTTHWGCGAQVQGNTSLQPGTVIATFAPSGRYANATDGSSHSAIYLGQTAQGVQVMDQWAGSPAAVRTIPWNNPGATAANTGGAFHVVTSA